LAIVAALDDVGGNARQEHARFAWHRYLPVPNAMKRYLIISYLRHRIEVVLKNKSLRHLYLCAGMIRGFRAIVSSSKKRVFISVFLGGEELN
jgi:hypothetical protein